MVESADAVALALSSFLAVAYRRRMHQMAEAIHGMLDKVFESTAAAHVTVACIHVQTLYSVCC